MYSSQRIDKEREETTVLRMNNDNSVDGKMSEMDYRIIAQQHTMPQIEIDQYNCTTNITIQSHLEGGEYRINYQRAYRKRQHEQINSIGRECQRVNQNQQEIQRNQIRRVDNMVGGWS